MCFYRRPPVTLNANTKKKKIEDNGHLPDTMGAQRSVSAPVRDDFPFCYSLSP